MPAAKAHELNILHFETFRSFHALKVTACRKFPPPAPFSLSSRSDSVIRSRTTRPLFQKIKKIIGFQRHDESVFTVAIVMTTKTRRGKPQRRIKSPGRSIAGSDFQNSPLPALRGQTSPTQMIPLKRIFQSKSHQRSGQTFSSALRMDSDIQDFKFSGQN